MEGGQRRPRKGRKLGSSRRWQTREPADGQDASGAPAPESWASRAAAEVQGFLRDCGAQDRGFVTRADLAVAKFSFLGSEEEPERIFDWVDVEQQGRLSLDEFSSGMKSILGYSQSFPGVHRRPRASLHCGREPEKAETQEKETDAQEKEAFSAFMEQWGTDPSFPDETEVWQLWRKLQQEGAPLAGNLEGFLAAMSSRLQEARADKEALELTLRKCDSDHHRKVQQLYEEMEQQLRQEKQQLQAESESRDVALSSEMQAALEAKERETQQLAESQRELEARMQQLSAGQQQASSEQRQLREAERDLTGQLEEVQGQLRVTRRHLATVRSRVSWQMEEKLRGPGAEEQKAADAGADAGAVSPLEGPSPEVLGDNADWTQLVGSARPPQGAPQVCWSPPPSPAGAPAPRVVRQISITEAHTLPCGQDLSPEPPGVTSRPQEEEGRGPPGQDSPSEPEVEPGLPGAPTEMAAALRVLDPVEGEARPHANGIASPPQTPAGPQAQVPASHLDDGAPVPGSTPAKHPQLRETVPQYPHSGHPGPVVLLSGLSLDLPGDGKPQTQGPGGQEDHPGEQTDPHGQTPRRGPEKGSSAEERKGLGPRGQHLSSEQAGDAQGLDVGNPLHAPLPSDGPPTQVEPDDPALRKPARSRGSPPESAQLGREVGSQELTPRLPTAAEMEAPPRPPLTAADAEGDGGPPESKLPGAESGPGDPRMDLARDMGLLPPLGSTPVGDPDYVFHVIFLGDSNVGKTSFLHLLYHNCFPAGLTATVGVDFRVKNVVVDNKTFALQLWDTAGQERYHSVAQHVLRKADAAVLMYDVTSRESFSHVHFWLRCLQDARCDEVSLLLLGNKTDCEEARQVPTEEGQQLAQELGASFRECSAALGHNILEPVVSLARSLKVQEDHLKDCLVEVAPTRPPHRAGCCS